MHAAGCALRRHPLTALRGLTLLVEFDGRAFDGEQHLLRPSIELLPFACPELRNLSLSWRGELCPTLVGVVPVDVQPCIFMP